MTVQGPDSDSPRRVHYMRRLLTTSADYAEEAEDILGRRRLNPEQVSTVLDLDPETGPGDAEAALQLIAVFEDDDPVGTIERFEGRLQSSPVHAVGPMNHIGMMPGTTPKPGHPWKNLPSKEPNAQTAIAAVDSGVTRQMPDWLRVAVDYEDPRDVERHPVRASHGTFVAGILRREAPEHTIYMAMADRVKIEKFSPPHPAGGPRAAYDPSTEIHVLMAVQRLIRRLQDADVRPDALNLSLGGYAHVVSNPPMLALRTAIDLWQDAFESPIYAAAGNRDFPDEVYPAAYDDVCGVAAINQNNDEVVWDEYENEIPLYKGSRSWVSQWAPGVNIDGPSGVPATPWVKWSGSSFATPQVTAALDPCGSPRTETK